MKKYEYTIATDGACKGNPGKGTWAFVVFPHNEKTVLGSKKGSSVSTTNNEMELKAILEALKWAQKYKKTVEILTDSNYALQGITSWMDSWWRKSWRKGDGSILANQKIWEEIHFLWHTSDHKITKVKGHSGNFYNDAADMYCNEEYMNKFI